MAEPSIAGQRVSGEKLSPDGSKVVFLWNAEGMPRRDLYLVSTTGGTPEKILSPSELPVPYRAPEKENKLDYGVEIRDEFVRERENQFGNFEWSPDSKRLIFTFGGDIYYLGLENRPASLYSEITDSKWKHVVSAIRKRLDLSPRLIENAKQSGVQEQDLFQQVEDLRSTLLKTLGNDSVASAGEELGEQRKHIFSLIDALQNSLSLLGSLAEKYPVLRSNESFKNLLDEMVGTENRLNVAILDYRFSLPTSKPERLTITQAPEIGARFLDNKRIVYSQSGHVFVMHLDRPLIIQLTRESNPQQFKTVGATTTSKDGNMLAYVVSDSSKQRQLIVPNFLPEFVTGGGPRRGWTEQQLFVTVTDGSRPTPHEIKLPKHEGLASFRRLVWAADNRSLIVDRLDKDTKRRQLFYVYNAGSKDEKVILITEETDDKWQAPKSAIFEPNPKNPAQLFFASERDGFNHLYLATLEAETRAVASVSDTNARVADGSPGYTANVKIEQLTRGNWQVEWARWSAYNRILFVSTQDSTAKREFFHLLPASNTIHRVSIIKNGFVSNIQLAQDDSDIRTFIYERSEWDKPGELFSSVSCNIKCEMKVPDQLTKTTPEAFKRIKWTVPHFIEIDSRDGKKIPAKIYLPPGHNPKSKTKYPMAIFVHGAGYLQNVINGWNNYYREFMFNDMLAKEGYVVLDIDFRGSAGYGREWRTDVHDFLGGKDFDDHIDSIDHMVKNNSVDQRRVGAYGGSYGGFMAAMLAMRAPDHIAAAAALRPVFDWKNYYAANPNYTAQRLGFPDQNPEAYKRSSPISYANQLERPLLILHGMVDDNVHVQDSIQLIEKLIRLNKTQYFEAMLYPSENHAFVRPESWADEYERIHAFFEKHLSK